ncbi:MAG: hypothetical protein OXC11_14365 [Rhodospirillales bacterium]|nr:hypothetical protein [Rhodospirillales bacterium]
MPPKREAEGSAAVLGCAAVLMLGLFLGFQAVCGESCRSCVRGTQRVLESTADDLDETARELEREEQERERRRQEIERRLKELEREPGVG